LLISSVRALGFEGAVEFLELGGNHMQVGNGERVSEFVSHEGKGFVGDFVLQSSDLINLTRSNGNDYAPLDAALLLKPEAGRKRVARTFQSLEQTPNIRERN
jgi:hypothetical protein